MAKICRNCGAEMSDDMFFCTRCGNKLSEEPAPEAEPIRCEEDSPEADAIFCGEDSPEADPIQCVEDSPEAHRERILLILGKNEEDEEDSRMLSAGFFSAGDL